MYWEIDFNSEEALYMQLHNQIIIGIATEVYREGDALPSVRQLADEIGINMHTVNKAYNVLRQEGFVKVDRRKGAVIAVDVDKLRALELMKKGIIVRDCTSFKGLDEYWIRISICTLEEDKKFIEIIKEVLN